MLTPLAFLYIKNMKREVIAGVLLAGFLFKGLPQPGELYGYCCLMPTAGCIIAMGMKRDTVRERKAREEWERIKNLPWYRKLSFGIGYSGGVCWTGEDLGKYETPPLDPSARFYWFPSIKGFVSYIISKNLEIGIVYTSLRHKFTGVWSNIFVLPYDRWTWHGSDYTLWGNEFSLFFKNKKNPGLSFSIGYVETKGVFEEYRSQGDTYTTFVVKNKGRGVVLGLGLEEEAPLIPSYLKIIFAMEVKMGSSWEFWNDATHPVKWLDPLDVVFTGVYFKIKIAIKGGAQ